MIGWARVGWAGPFDRLLWPAWVGVGLYSTPRVPSFIWKGIKQTANSVIYARPSFYPLIYAERGYRDLFFPRPPGLPPLYPRDYKGLGSLLI